MKRNTLMNTIINLAKFIMSEEEFSKFMVYLKMKLYARLRLFVEEILEDLETKFILYRDNTVLEAQIEKCKRLDVLVTDLYVDSLVTSP